MIVVDVETSTLCAEWRSSHEGRIVQCRIWLTANWRSGTGNPCSCSLLSDTDNI